MVTYGVVKLKFYPMGYGMNRLTGLENNEKKCKFLKKINISERKNTGPIYIMNFEGKKRNFWNNENIWEKLRDECV